MYSFSPRLWVFRVWFLFAFFLVVVLCYFGFSLAFSFAVFSWRLVSRYSYLVFLGMVIFFSFSLFHTSIIPSNKCLLTLHSWPSTIWFRLEYTKTESLSKVFDTHSDYKCMHSLFQEWQDASAWSQDNGMCKVRQRRIHSTGKLLLSTESGLKRSRHDDVPNSREFSLFAFWEWLGTVPSPGTKQKALKSCSNSHLSADCSASLFQQRDWQGSHALWLQTFPSPNTSHSKSRQQDKSLDSLSQEVPFLWRTLLGLHPWRFDCFWQLQEVEGHGWNMPTAKRIHSLLLGAAISQKSKT